MGGIEIPEDEYQVISLDPVIVVFDTPPPNGPTIDILVRNGITWYEQGATTASNGEPLQTTQTVIARFLRGL